MSGGRGGDESNSDGGGRGGFSWMRIGGRGGGSMVRSALADGGVNALRLMVGAKLRQLF